MIYKNRAEEVTHKSKVDLTNLKMDMLKQRGDLERERDKLSNLVEGNYLVIVLLKPRLLSCQCLVEAKVVIMLVCC